MESILISLFGFGGAGMRKNDVLRRDATPEKFQTELTFWYEGVHFKLVRGNETALESSPDGLSWTLVSDNANEINRYIEQTLGVSARKFRDLFYSAQGELTNVITGSAEERQRSIDKLLGAEGLRETFDNLMEFVKFYDKEIGQAEGRLSDVNAYLKRSNLEQLREEKRKGEQEVIQIGEKIQSLSKEIAFLTGQLDHLARKARPIQDAYETVQRMERSIRDKEANLANKAFQLGQLRDGLSESAELVEKNRSKLATLRPRRDEAERVHREWESVYERLSDLRSRALGLAEQRSMLAQRVESLREDLKAETLTVAEIEREIEETEGKLMADACKRKELEKSVSAIQQLIGQINVQIASEEEQLRSCELKANSIHAKVVEDAEKVRRLSSLSEGAQCPFCEQPVSVGHRAKVIARVEGAVKRLLREEEDARRSADGSRRALEELKARIESENQTLTNLRMEISSLDTELARHGQNKSNLEKNLHEARLRRQKCEDDLRREIAALEGLSSELLQMTKASGLEGEGWVADLERRLAEARSQVQQAGARLAQIDAEINSADQSIVRLEAEIQEDTARLEEVRRSVVALEAELSEARREILSVYEPIVGRVDDPEGKLFQVLAEITKEMEDLKDKISSKLILRERLSGEYKQKNDWVAQMDERIREYIQEQRKAAVLKRTLSIYSESKNLLQQIREKYKDAREMIRTNLVNVLQETLRVEFGRLYAYEDFHDVEVSDDYEVSLIGPTGRIEAHNLSAGQKAIVSIAFRLAVAKAMKMNIGCWIIDEPTQNIGKSEVEALADVLADTSEIPQIIVATHHEALGRHGNVITLDIRDGETVLGADLAQLARPVRPETVVD